MRISPHRVDSSSAGFASYSVLVIAQKHCSCYGVRMRLLRFVRVILPALVGNILEWYEFAIYSYFATDISHQFFPQQDALSALIETFAVFAMGLLMRPIGALIFGYFADTLGRKKVLPISIILMALSTGAIGCVPSYAQIGIWSGILLVLCRMLQGLSVAGEYSSSMAYVFEQAPHRKKGFLGSLTLFGAYLGIILGSGVSTLLSYFAKDTLYYDYAWRGAFIVGLFLGILGLYLRRNLPETPEFIEAKSTGRLLKNPVKDLIFSHPKKLLLGIGLTLSPAIASWLAIAYFTTYTTRYGKMAEYQALALETYTMLLVLIAIPIIGYLSDRIGRFFFWFFSPFLLLIFSYALFHPLLSSSIGVVFLAQGTFALMYVMSEALIPSTLASIFPVNQRCTGIALCLNFTNGLFGGTVPLVATLLIEKTGYLYAPAGYLMLSTLVTLWAVRIYHKQRKTLTF